MTHAPRILVVTTVPETMRALVLPTLRRLRQMDWEVHIATAAGQAVPSFAEIGVVHHLIPMTRTISPFADLKAILKMMELCWRHQFDLVHTHTLKASLVGQLGAALGGVGVRTETVHGTRFMPDLPFAMKWAILGSERLAAYQAQRVWVSNRDDLQLFESKHLVRRGTATVLGPGGVGVDLIKFRPDLLAGQARSDYRRNLGLPPAGPVVGFVGRLVVDKGVRELMQAWPSVLAKIPAAHLLIVAPVLTSERTNETISTEQLSALPNTVRLANRSDMAELYNCMDLLVLPTYREGFPCTILEASACGVPVVATDVKGCREGVVPGRSGQLIAPRSASAIVESVVELLVNESMRRTLGSQARELACERFDQEPVIDRTIETYIKLLRQRSRRKLQLNGAAPGK